MGGRGRGIHVVSGWRSRAVIVPSSDLSGRVSRMERGAQLGSRVRLKIYDRL